MTPEQIEKHRKRFEELSGLHEMYLMRDSNGQYCRSDVRARFNHGYLLCAENQEVDLPNPIKWREAESIEGAQHRYCVNGLLKEIRSSLESQGIKIKSSGSE